MSFRSLVLLVLGAAMVLFVGINWTEMSRSTELSLLVTTVNAPLGWVLLSMMGLLSGLFVAWMALTQAQVWSDARRQSKALAAQRELADKAELSRLTELRNHLNTELGKLAETVQRQSQDVMARVDRLEIGLGERLRYVSSHATGAAPDTGRSLTDARPAPPLISQVVGSDELDSASPQVTPGDTLGRAVRRSAGV